jgi:hypothetical protein
VFALLLRRRAPLCGVDHRDLRVQDRNCLRRHCDPGGGLPVESSPSACRGVDRSEARALVGGGFPAPPFRLRGGVTVPPSMFLLLHLARTSARKIKDTEGGGAPQGNEARARKGARDKQGGALTANSNLTPKPRGVCRQRGRKGWTVAGITSDALRDVLAQPVSWSSVFSRSIRPVPRGRFAGRMSSGVGVRRAGLLGQESTVA